MFIKNIEYIIGVDEAGRGPLAGPLAVGAVAWRKEFDYKKRFDGVRDSKKLSSGDREKFFYKICVAAREGELAYAVSFVEPKTIDSCGVTESVRKGVSRVISKIGYAPPDCKIILDGRLYAPKKYIVQETIIGGDALEPLISLASIVAKVLRDRKMILLSQKYPHYGFEKHKGYGTREHYAALRKYGISPAHRKLFLRKNTDIN